MNEESEPKKGALVGIVIILVVLLIGAVWVATKKFDQNVSSAPVLVDELIQYGTSTPVSLAFSYPSSLFLEERQLGNGERGHVQILLMDDTEENRLLREGKSPPRDGPVTITVDVIDNEFENLSLNQWILNDSRSNYKLATSPVSSTTIVGLPAISYSATGLYESDVVVVLVGKYVVLFTVTYITKDDSLRQIFTDTVLSTLVMRP